jgi:hypothetical protein
LKQADVGRWARRRNYEIDGTWTDERMAVQEGNWWRGGMGCAVRLSVDRFVGTWWSRDWEKSAWEISRKEVPFTSAAETSMTLLIHGNHEITLFTLL